MARLRLVWILTLAGAAAVAPRAATIPRKCPDFTIQRPSPAAPVRLSQYQGKTVALLFILTTCPHCQNAVRCLSREQEQLGPRGFQALASAIDQTGAANLPGFLHDFQPRFPVGFNDVMGALAFLQHPPMVGPRMPLIAFIDRSGMIRGQYEGQEDFFAEERMAANIHRQLLTLLGADETPGKSAPGGRTPSKRK